MSVGEIGCKCDSSAAEASGSAYDWMHQSLVELAKESIYTRLTFS